MNHIEHKPELLVILQGPPNSGKDAIADQLASEDSRVRHIKSSSIICTTLNAQMWPDDPKPFSWYDENKDAFVYCLVTNVIRQMTLRQLMINTGMAIRTTVGADAFARHVRELWICERISHKAAKQKRKPNILVVSGVKDELELLQYVRLTQPLHVLTAHVLRDGYEFTDGREYTTTSIGEVVKLQNLEGQLHDTVTQLRREVAQRLRMR